MASPTGQTGRGKFPKTLILMVSEEFDEFVRETAATEGRSLSEVGRELMDAGRKAIEKKRSRKKSKG